MTQDRPPGIVVLAALALLGAICAAGMAAQVLHPILPASGTSSLSLLDLAAAFIFIVLVPAFGWITYTFLTIDLSDWYSSVGISLLNLALIIFSGTSLAVSLVMTIIGVPWQIAAPALIVYGFTIVYCLMLDRNRAFGSSRT